MYLLLVELVKFLYSSTTINGYLVFLLSSKYQCVSRRSLNAVSRASRSFERRKICAHTFCPRHQYKTSRCQRTLGSYLRSSHESLAFKTTQKSPTVVFEPSLTHLVVENADSFVLRSIHCFIRFVITSGSLDRVRTPLVSTEEYVGSLTSPIPS